MNIEDTLDEIEDMVQNAKSVPFSSHKIIVDGDRMLELIHEAQLNVPTEIKRAKLIDADCDRLIKESQDKAEIIIQEAEARSKQMVSENAVLQEAQKRSADILTQAQNGSNDVKAAAEKYILSILTEVQDQLEASYQEIDATRTRIEELNK